MSKKYIVGEKHFEHYDKIEKNIMRPVTEDDIIMYREEGLIMSYRDYNKYGTVDLKGRRPQMGDWIERSQADRQKQWLVPKEFYEDNYVKMVTSREQGEFKDVDILTFINSIRQSDKNIETIYMNGGCFQFYVLLQTVFGGCQPLINEDENHVITRFKGKFYDITGEIKEGRYNSMTVEQLRMCEKWSFSKNRALVIGRCKFCDEPIIV